MISAKDVTRMAVWAAVVLLAAGACQASVIANLSLSVDQVGQKWYAYLTLSDPANQTLGLHGVYIDVWGSQTKAGPWSGPLSISTHTIKLPKGMTDPDDEMAVGFTSNTANGTKVGTGYTFVGAMQSNEYVADSHGYTSIIMGVGEVAGSHQIGTTRYINYTNPVLVAQGAYTGTVGWINVSAATTSMTLLPASLSLPTVFSSFSPGGVNGASVYAPEPATLALMGLGGLILSRKRK